MSFPSLADYSVGEFLRDARGNPLPDESLLVLTHIDRLEREIAALRKDKERLDWLEAGGEPETYEDAPHALVWCVLGETGQRSIRAAIDAARKEATP